MISEANASQPPSVDAWERPMVFTAKMYDDDINEMFQDLSSLVREARELQKTSTSKRFNLLRMPAFILGSNKLRVHHQKKKP
jgi:hypothetical protein